MATKKSRVARTTSRKRVSDKPAVPTGATPRQAEKMAATDAIARSLPFNSGKPSEYDLDSALNPPEGDHFSVPPDVAASTLSEANASEKAGEPAESGENPNNGLMDRVR